MNVHKLARKIAIELVLLPKEHRGKAYNEAYLKETSGCRTWPRLRCAYCNCHKRGKGR